MNYAEESLKLHRNWRGKIEVISRVQVDSKDSLSLAYTPGVAQPCLEIQKDPDLSYELTRRHNLCAVITDGSAVLGLGDIGPEAGMPVMEGTNGHVGRHVFIVLFLLNSEKILQSFPITAFLLQQIQET